MKIVLVGYMGAGKSTVGRALAEKSGLPFVDLDTEIEKEQGEKVSQIIFTRGELTFRQLERAKLEELLKKDRFVMSVGGGTPCYYDNIDLINRSALSIYLQLGVKELYHRLEGTQGERPLIAHQHGNELMEFIGKHLFERQQFYEKAIFTIQAGKKYPPEITAEILEMAGEKE